MLTFGELPDLTAVPFYILSAMYELQLLHLLGNIYYCLIIFCGWKVVIWFCFAFHEWWIILSIFSCAYCFLYIIYSFPIELSWDSCFLYFLNLIAVLSKKKKLQKETKLPIEFSFLYFKKYNWHYICIQFDHASLHVTYHAHLPTSLKIHWPYYFYTLIALHHVIYSNLFTSFVY